jgi:hypothetical protein
VELFLHSTENGSDGLSELISEELLSHRRAFSSKCSYIGQCSFSTRATLQTDCTECTECTRNLTLITEGLQEINSQFKLLGETLHENRETNSLYSQPGEWPPLSLFRHHTLHIRRIRCVHCQIQAVETPGTEAGRGAVYWLLSGSSTPLTWC